MSAPTYRNAFKCRKCPGRSDADGCPAWTVDTWENDQTRQVETVSGCIFKLLPMYLKFGASRAMAAMETMQELRNENQRVVAAYGRSLQVLQRVMETDIAEAAQLQHEPHEGEKSPDDGAASRDD